MHMSTCQGGKGKYSHQLPEKRIRLDRGHERLEDIDGYVSDRG